MTHVQRIGSVGLGDSSYVENTLRESRGRKFPVDSLFLFPVAEMLTGYISP